MNKTTRWAPGALALADAAVAVSSIAFHGRSADVALAPFVEVPHRAAVRAITLGCVRWYLRIAPAVESLLPRPEGIAVEVRALLVAAAHQIQYSRSPAETNANAAVDAARILRQRHAAGLVNAVLRRFVAERTGLFARVDEELAVRTAHPQWLLDEVRRAWPEHLEAILEANNIHPPMTVRVDTSRTPVADYLRELAAVELQAQAVTWAPAAVQLEHPVPVSSLPGFSEGRVSVQDAGAQLAAELLDAKPSMNVLDACAAPGGKTGHLLERTPGLSALTAVDIDAERVGRIHDNLRRLKRQARVLVADVREPQAFWDGKPFDRILVDAPCSSTGVIRRHPDIKLLRRPTDISSLAKFQFEILGAAFSMLSEGGKLLYVTCSVLPEENEAVITAFLKAQPQARSVKISSLPPGALAKAEGFQLLPGGPAGTDGYYYVCLEKTTTGN